MATKLQKVPSGILPRSEVKLLNSSVIYEDIDLEFGRETNFGPLN